MSVVLLFGMAGTAMAAKAAKAVVITKLEENIAPGHVIVKTQTATTAATLTSNLTIKGMKMTWLADEHTKDNKTFYGIIDKAVIKKEYVFTVGKAFSLAKGVDAKVIWKEEMIEIIDMHFLSKPGEMMFTVKKAVTADKLKGKVRINKVAANITAAPDSKGTMWIAKVPNLKPEVEYPIEFLRPLNGGTFTMSWQKVPMMLTGATLDAAAGTIKVVFGEPPYETVTLEHFKIEAYMGGNPITLSGLSYKDGVISFTPVTERAYPEDKLMIILQGNPEKMVSGFFQLME